MIETELTAILQVRFKLANTLVIERISRSGSDNQSGQCEEPGGSPGKSKGAAPSPFSPSFPVASVGDAS